MTTDATQVDSRLEFVVRKGGYFYRPKAEGYTPYMISPTVFQMLLKTYRTRFAPSSLKIIVRYMTGFSTA